MKRGRTGDCRGMAEDVLWSCWHGDVRPVLRPEAHHRDLEDHWGPLVETGRTKGKGEPEWEGDEKASSADMNLELPGCGLAPVYLLLRCGEPVPSSSSSLSSLMPFSLCRAKSSNTMSSSLVEETRKMSCVCRGRQQADPNAWPDVGRWTQERTTLSRVSGTTSGRKVCRATHLEAHWWLWGLSHINDKKFASQHLRARKVNQFQTPSGRMWLCRGIPKEHPKETPFHPSKSNQQDCFREHAISTRKLVLGSEEEKAYTGSCS